MPTVRCAVLGKPVGHSLSPVLHRAAYDALGLTDWSYEAVEVDDAGLADFLLGLGDSWRGLSLTMPLKRAVLPLLDSVDDWARLSGAANTVILDNGRRHGCNTDVSGVQAALGERVERPLDRAVVLGGGATAASVLLALAEIGCAEATVLVREPGRASETVGVVARHRRPPVLTVGRLGDRIARADIVVSTIPAGAQTPSLVRSLSEVPVVFDVLYDPWPTPLAAAAQATGRTLVSGLDLLIGQALHQVALMTGELDPPRAAMRTAGERALAERS